MIAGNGAVPPLLSHRWVMAAKMEVIRVPSARAEANGKKTPTRVHAQEKHLKRHRRAGHWPSSEKRDHWCETHGV